MKFLFDFEMVEIDDDIMLVPLSNTGNSKSFVLRINKESKWIIEYIHDGKSESEIVDLLNDKFENSREQLEKYVHDFIAKLKNEGILE